MEAEERTTFNSDASDTIETDVDPLRQNEDTAASSADTTGTQPEDDQAPTNGFKRKRTPPPDGMSISAFKKLKRQQKWEAGRLDRKLKKKEKEREKKEARRAAIASGEALPPPPKPPKEKSVTVPVTIVIDCGFDELMFENEIKSLAGQITRSYSDNTRAKYRVHLAVSGFDKRLRERFETVLEAQYKGWKGIKFYDEDFVEVASKAMEKMADAKSGGMVEGALSQTSSEDSNSPENSEVIYLSSESENIIDNLSPYSIYIIGGLVDRNRHKGLCYKRACDRGIKTAKLPIGEFMEMNSRQVLATNHVNEIMLHWLEVGDWGEAFMKVIPKRKGGVLKGGSKDEAPGEGEEGGGEEEDGEGERPAGEAEDKADGATAGIGEKLGDNEDG